MRRTIPQQIAANKRGSFVFLILMFLLLSALGGSIGAVYQPSYWMYWGGGAAGLGLLTAFIARFAGPGIVLSAAGARPATHVEDQVLDNVVEEMAIAAGIPKPSIYVIDDPSPNAFATGTHPNNAAVCATTGLLNMLNREELQGVIGHEISHIRNYDIRFMTIVGLVAGLIPMLSDMFRWSLWGGRSRDRGNDGATVMVIVGVLLAIVAPLFAMLLQLAISRKREFLADASSVELTRNPEGLARALLKLGGAGIPLIHRNRATQHLYIVNPLKMMRAMADTERSSVFDTHPPIGARVRALMGTLGTSQITLGAAPPPRG